MVSFLQISRMGYYEQFIVGLLVSGLVCYLIFKKTGNKLKKIIFVILITTLIGIFKEVIDPYWGHDKDKHDLIYTFLGGVV